MQTQVQIRVRRCRQREQAGVGDRVSGQDDRVVKTVACEQRGDIWLLRADRNRRKRGTDIPLKPVPLQEEGGLFTSGLGSFAGHPKRPDP